MAIMKNKEFTHDELTFLGNRWLRNQKGCPLVVREMGGSNAEIPDVIGWNSSRSHLIEVKILRSDFLADKKKVWRAQPEKGMGMFRYFLTPKGLIAEDELPEKWGLLNVRGSSQIVLIHHATPFKQYDMQSELWMTVAASRRLQAGCPYIAGQLGVRKDDKYQEGFKL